MNAQGLRTKHLGTVELRIPRKAEWVAVARLAIAAVANRLPLSVEDVEDLKIAVAEACTHCIQHPSPADAIAIHCQASSDALTIDVRDAGFNPLGSRLSEPSDANSAETSLGVFLIATLMDDVQHRIDLHSRTALAMTKRVTR